MSAPAFLNKPKHKDNVIATPKGWVVEKTGELLVSVKNLDQRIAEHLGLPTFKFDGLAAQIDASIIDEVLAPVATADSIDDLLDALDTAKPDVVVEDIVEDVVKEVEKVEEQVPVVTEKKKRGGYRPRKPKVDA